MSIPGKGDLLALCCLWILSIIFLFAGSSEFGLLLATLIGTLSFAGASSSMGSSLQATIRTSVWSFSRTLCLTLPSSMAFQFITLVLLATPKLFPRLFWNAASLPLQQLSSLWVSGSFGCSQQIGHDAFFVVPLVIVLQLCQVVFRAFLRLILEEVEIIYIGSNKFEVLQLHVPLKRGSDFLRKHCCHHHIPLSLWMAGRIVKRVEWIRCQWSHLSTGCHVSVDCTCIHIVDSPRIARSFL